MTSLAGWRKSSHCETGQCAEVASADAVVGVRDGKLAESPVLVFGVAAWREFTAGLRAGEV